MKDRETGQLSAQSTALVDEIRQDREHGASWLARHATAILAQSADEAIQRAGNGLCCREDLDALAALCWELAWARPSMAAIASAIASVWARAVPPGVEGAENASSSDIDASLKRLRSAALEFAEQWESATAAIAEAALPLLHEPIFTLSRSATVENTLLAAARAHRPNTPLRVIVAESIPGGEGIALTHSLSAAGARTMTVRDSSVGIAMAEVGTLLLGADSVRHDGSLINKVGSYPAALAAKDLGIPVLALCEHVKIAATSYPVILERELAADESADGVEGWLFDLTPARLLTAIITEDGPLTLDSIAKAADDGEARLTSLKAFVEAASQRRPDHSA